MHLYNTLFRICSLSTAGTPDNAMVVIMICIILDGLVNSLPTSINVNFTLVQHPITTPTSSPWQSNSPVQLAIAATVDQPEISAQRLCAFVASEALRMEPVWTLCAKGKFAWIPFWEENKQPALVSLKSRLQEPLVAACAKHCLLFLHQFCSCMTRYIYENGKWHTNQV